MEWNGDILKVMEEDDDLTYVIPDEGEKFITASEGS